MVLLAKTDLNRKGEKAERVRDGGQILFDQELWPVDVLSIADLPLGLRDLMNLKVTALKYSESQLR